MEKIVIYNVPCNGCTLCCHADAIRVLPQDDSSLYETVPHPYFPDQLMLKHKSNGDCFYLGESGCTIHDHKPIMCREMDCRTIFKAVNFTKARKYHKQGKLRFSVWQRGKELCKNTNNG